MCVRVCVSMGLGVGVGVACQVCGMEHVVKGERDTNVENTRQASTAGTAASAGRHEKQLHGNHVVFFWNTIVVVVASYPEFIPVRSRTATATLKSYQLNDNAAAPEASVFQSLRGSMTITTGSTYFERERQWISILAGNPFLSRYGRIFRQCVGIEILLEEIRFARHRHRDHLTETIVV